jgi:hypothetical protein
VFPVTLAAGLLVIAAVALSPLYADRVEPPPGSTALGAGFVAAAFLLAVPAALWHVALLPSVDEVFLAAFALLLFGALLIVAGGRDEGRGADDDEPPWWPRFELDFRSYARRRSPLAPTSSRR